MNVKHNFTYFLRNLNEKHRLSVRNQHNDQEVWYMHISPLSIFASFLAVVLVLFIVIITTVAYTPILDFIPGYPGNKSRELLISNIMRLDSMERQMNGLLTYTENVALIMEGKTPIVRNVDQIGDSMKLTKPELVGTSAEDAILRAQIEGEGPYKIGEKEESAKKLRDGMELIRPVSGVIASAFDPKNGDFGVGVATADNHQVMAVGDGTVVFSSWSPEDGYIIQLQHANNLMSIYKHNSRLIKKVGDRVRSGEVVSYTADGTTGDQKKNLLFFELWHNGVPVDPARYIAF